MAKGRKTLLSSGLPVLLCLVPLLFPSPSFCADIEVIFQEITALNGAGQATADIYPGEEIRVRVRLRVLQTTGNPFSVRLRISGDGWHAIPAPKPLAGPGVHILLFDALQAPAVAGPGKVSLLADVLASQATVSLLGRRHAYVHVRCPPEIPAGTARRLPVGSPPSDMALTADGRFLYVTSKAKRKVTVIDVEEEAVAAEIEDPEALGAPTGEAFFPGKSQMFVADSGLQALHIIDAETHVIQDTIPLNPTGDFGLTAPGDVAVNPIRNEAYVADSRAPRIFVVNLGLYPPGVRGIPLFGLPPPPVGLFPVQILLDPDNTRWIYVLCQGMNEVIKLDVVSGAIVDFVRLRGLEDPADPWPAWSMALNPVTRRLYVVANPGEIASRDPLTIQSKIYVLPKNWLGGPGRGDLRLGSSIWEVAVREDGRFVYAIDSYRGEILIIDMQTGTEMSRCAVPVEAGGRFLRADPAHSRLFVGGLLAGFLDIVE